MALGNAIGLMQKHQLSQTQQQSLELLAMDSAQLETFLQQEYLENPLLEYDRKSADREAIDIFAEYDRRKRSESITADAEDDPGDRWSDIPAAQERSLKQFILDQLPQKGVNISLVRYLTDSLDDDGFFTMNVGDVSSFTGCSPQEVEQTLKMLRDLEPYGIFANDLRECLLKQLDMMEMKDSLAYRIADAHLDDVTAGRISSISRELKVPTAQVRQALAYIARLNPRPAAAFGSMQTSYIRPDIIVKREDNSWEVEFNDKWTEDYHVSDYYVSLMHETDDPELTEYFNEKYERITFIMKSIEHRRQTLTAITRELLKCQDEYFGGNACLKPMTMSEISERTGMHASTVSRAIRGKYLQSPRGTILMKSLFSAALESDDELKIASAMQAKEQIKELIRQEDPAKPYSDQTIVQLLSESGIRLSRRAVAKYREELGIRGSYDRKMVQGDDRQKP